MCRGSKSTSGSAREGKRQPSEDPGDMSKIVDRGREERYTAAVRSGEDMDFPLPSCSG
jgi:hypothetical protein